MVPLCNCVCVPFSEMCCCCVCIVMHLMLTKSFSSAGAVVCSATCQPYACGFDSRRVIFATVQFQVRASCFAANHFKLRIHHTTHYTLQLKWVKSLCTRCCCSTSCAWMSLKCGFDTHYGSVNRRDACGPPIHQCV